MKGKVEAARPQAPAGVHRPVTCAGACILGYRNPDRPPSDSVLGGRQMIADCLRKLTASLADSDRNVRLRAVRSVRLIMDWGGPNSLIPYGTRRDPDALEYCTAALVEGHSLIEFVLAVLPSLAGAIGVNDEEACSREAKLARDKVVYVLGQASEILLPALGRGSTVAARGLGRVGKALVAAKLDETLREVLLGYLVNALRAALKGDMAVSIDAANALREIGPDAFAAVPDLIDAIRQRADGTLVHDAAYALGAIGPAASEAIPALEELAAHSYVAFRLAGMDALRMIRGDRLDAGGDAPVATRADLA